VFGIGVWFGEGFTTQEGVSEECCTGLVTDIIYAMIVKGSSNTARVLALLVADDHGFCRERFNLNLKFGIFNSGVSCFLPTPDF
jgi:hypothetical protein